MKRVHILTDSTSDVPPEMAERLRITVVPAYVHVGNRSYRDAPGLSDGLGREEFYAQLPSMPDVPTTAVPPIRDFVTAYGDLAGEAEEVIAIVLATALSGMYDVALLGAQQTPGLKVHVVDSEQLSMGHGWIVVAAAKAAAEGKSVPEILALIEDMKPRVHIYAMLDTLEYVRRGGRVSWARAKAAQMLRIKPIMKVIRGNVSEQGRSRTRRRAIEQLIELVRALGPLERLAVIHTYAPDVEEFRHRLADFCPLEQLPTVAVNTIIGAHVGPRGLGVAAVTAT